MISRVEERTVPNERPQTDQEWEALFAAYDVRPVLSAMRAAGEPDLGRIDWARYSHWYGTAAEVPDLLRVMTGPDPDEASKALSRLSGRLVHQLCTSAPAAFAVPFLLRIAADPRAPQRRNVLALASWAGHRVNFTVEKRSTLFQVSYPPGVAKYGPGLGDRADWIIQAAREALGADAAILVHLLDDDDPDVRIEAAFALATALDLPPEAQGSLRSRLAVEANPAVRVNLVLAIGQLDRDTRQVEQWWRDPRQPTDIRLAAAIAWVCLTDLPVPEDLASLFELLGTEEIQQAFRRVPWMNYDPPRYLQAWIDGLLRE